MNHAKPIMTLLLTLAAFLAAGSNTARVQAQQDAPDRPAAQAQPADDAPAAPIKVALLTYGEDQTAVCFADAFLTTYARETEQEIQRTFERVALSSDALFDYPFVVLSGERPFEPSEKEQANLKRYIERGGFVLASAGCSNRAWADSFTAAMDTILGEHSFEPIQTDHLLFHTLFDIDTIDVRRPGGRVAVYGHVVDGRIRVLFSPLGLNDTANAGGGCCCCGGSEIRNAKLINANALAYALVQ